MFGQTEAGNEFTNLTTAVGVNVKFFKNEINIALNDSGDLASLDI